MRRSLVVGWCALVGACGSTPAAPAPPTTTPATPDAGLLIDAAPPPTPADAAPVVEQEEVEGDDDDDPLTGLGATLDAQPFTYLRLRTVTVATTVFRNELSPSPFGDLDAEVFAVALPGGPSLVCVVGELCWGIEGEMKDLYVPEDALMTMAAPYLTVIAVLPGKARVELTVSLDDASESLATARPARQVDTFAPDAAPTWAQPWTEWLDDLRGIHIASDTTPVEHVFVTDNERGVLCIARDAGYQCGEPMPTGAGQGDVSYAPARFDFGSTIVAVIRDGHGETDEAYHSAGAILLFDTSDAALPWIATIPSWGHSRTSLKPDQVIPLLDVYLAWDLRPAKRRKALDPRCFELRRSKTSEASKYVSDPDGDEGVGVRRASLPKLKKARTVPRDATLAQLSVGSDFAGTWSVSADGSLVRTTCRSGRS